MGGQEHKELGAEEDLLQVGEDGVERCKENLAHQ